MTICPDCGLDHDVAACAAEAACCDCCDSIRRAEEAAG